ncbi:MAG: YciC family protein [Candidatus Saccharimonadales bacterium]
MATPATPTKVGSVFDLPAKSVKLVRENLAMFALVNIVSIITAVLAVFGSRNTHSESEFANLGTVFGGIKPDNDLVASVGLGLVIFIVTLAASVFLYAMATSLQLRVTRGERPAAHVLIETAKKYWLRQLALFIVMGFIIGVGLLLLIVPGIFAIIRLSLAPYLMFEKDLAIIDALKSSNELAKQNMGAIGAALLLFLAISIGAGIISAIPYVGQLLATAISIAYSLILVLRYREITGFKKDKVASPIHQS